MTEIPISPEIWKLAGEILTEKQLLVLELREKHGFSWHQIAVYTNRTKAACRDHYAAATKNIYDELNRRTEATNGSITKEGNPPTNPQTRPASGAAARDPAAHLAVHPDLRQT